jgi:hypothetical protein
MITHVGGESVVHAECEGVYGHSLAVNSVSSSVCMIGLPGTTVVMSMPLRV